MAQPQHAPHHAACRMVTGNAATLREEAEDEQRLLAAETPVGRRPRTNEHILSTQSSSTRLRFDTDAANGTFFGAL